MCTDCFGKEESCHSTGSPPAITDADRGSRRLAVLLHARCEDHAGPTLVHSVRGQVSNTERKEGELLSSQAALNHGPPLRQYLYRNWPQAVPEEGKEGT